MKKSVLIAFGLVYGNSLFAADERGNGGDAVVCRDNSGAITSAEVLDHFEARIQHGIDIDVGLPGMTVNEAVSNVIGRLADFDETRIANYRKWAEQFDAESVYLRDVTLVDVPDSVHIAVPTGCAVEQLALQRIPTLPRQKRYTINQDIWDKLDDENKAFLIVHEIIYRDALNSGHLNSVNTRYLTALLSEVTFSEMSLTEYADLMVTLGFRIQEVCESARYLIEKGSFRSSGYEVSESFCYIPGSKEELSESTFRAVLSRPFNLRTAVVVHYSGQQGDFFGMYLSPQYSTERVAAFKELTVSVGIGKSLEGSNIFALPGFYAVGAPISFRQR